MKKPKKKILSEHGKALSAKMAVNAAKLSHDEQSSLPSPRTKLQHLIYDRGLQDARRGFIDRITTLENQIKNLQDYNTAKRNEREQQKFDMTIKLVSAVGQAIDTNCRLLGTLEDALARLSR